MGGVGLGRVNRGLGPEEGGEERGEGKRDPGDTSLAHRVRGKVERFAFLSRENMSQNGRLGNLARGSSLRVP